MSLAYQVYYAIEMFAWSRWGGLAVLGLLTILAAALLERHKAAIAIWSRRFVGRLGDWQP